MEYIRVASLSDLAEGRPVRAGTPAGDPVAVFRVGDAVFCIDDTCSHAFASLSEGTQSGGTVTCPLHGGQFDIASGRAVRLPATAAVRTHPVRVEGDDVLVGIEDEEDDY